MSLKNREGSVARKLLSGSVLRMGSLLFAAISSFALMPIMVHHLGDRNYGFWSLAAAFIGYYGLLDLGLSNAVAQFLCVALGRKDTGESRGVFNTALFLQTVLGCVALVVTVLLALSADRICKHPGDAAVFWRVITVIGVTAAIGFPVRVYRGVLQAQLQFEIQSGLDLLGLVLRAGVIVYTMLSGHGLLALAWGTSIASLPVLGLQVWFARRRAEWARIGGTRLDKARAKHFFNYSAYTFAAQIADILRFQVDALVISTFLGLAAVMHYRIATVFSNYYINALVELVGLFAPLMSRYYGAGDHAALERTFFFTTKASMAVSVLICGGVIVWGRAFIQCWMGARYEDAYWPMVILATAVFLDVSQSASVVLMYTTFNQRFYTYVNSAEGVLNLVLSLALARPLGLMGVALGTLIAAIVIRLIVQPIVVCRLSSIPLGRYVAFLVGNFARCALLIVLAAVSFRWAIRPHYTWLAGSALCATALYAAGYLLFVLNRSEREEFQRSIFRDRPTSNSAVAPIAQ